MISHATFVVVNDIAIEEEAEMLIIAEQKEGRKGVYYEIMEPQSGVTRRWSPPSGMSIAQTREMIQFIARTMEEDVSSSSQAAAQPICEQPQKENELLQPTKDMTLKEFTEHVFLPRKLVTISEQTRDRWEGDLDRYIYPMLGRFRLSDIKPFILTDFFTQLQSYGLSKGSVDRFYTLLRLIMKMAFMMEVLDSNPMDRVERPRARKDESASSPSAYTPEEVVQIMDHLSAEPLKYRCMIMLMAETGIRRGECCGLTWDCVHFSECRLDIDKAVYYTKSKGVYVDTPKSKKKRSVYVSKAMMSMLQELELVNFATTGSKFVFTQVASDQPLHPHTLTKYCASFSEKYGIAHMHPHKLRHTFASIAVLAGADIVSVADLLGHSRSDVLLRYYTNSNDKAKQTASTVYQKAIEIAKNQ